MPDIVLTNSFSVYVSPISDSIVPIDNYHPPLNLTYPLFVDNLHSPVPEAFFGFNSILSLLGSIDWSDVFHSSNDIVTNVEQFYSILFFSINLYIPKRKITSYKFPNWFSNKLKLLIKNKNIAHASYKKSYDHLEYLKFSSLSTQCKNQSKIDYSNYLNFTQHSFKSNPKQFWYFIKNIRYSPSFPNSLSFNGIVVDDAHSIVELFSMYFSSVYKKKNNILSNTLDSYPVHESFDPITNCEINLLDVFSELVILNNNTTVGSDGLSPIFLYNCRFIVSRLIQYLFNISLHNGYFPKKRKISKKCIKCFM